MNQVSLKPLHSPFPKLDLLLMDISADIGFVLCWGLEHPVMTEISREKVSLERGWDVTGGY